MRWFGLILLFLAGWSWYQGAGTFVVATSGALALLLLAGSAAATRLTAARASGLLAGLRRPAAALRPGTPEPV